jgi:hypothetical protein
VGRAATDSEEVDMLVELAVGVSMIEGDPIDWGMAEEEGRVPSGPAPVCRDSGVKESGTGVVWDVVCGVAVADVSTRLELDIDASDSLVCIADTVVAGASVDDTPAGGEVIPP